MKKYTNHYYEAKHTNDNGGLYLSYYTQHEDDFDKVVGAILYAEQTAAAAGYKPTKYIIVECECERVYDGDMFMSETVTRKTIAIYDNGTVTRI